MRDPVGSENQFGDDGRRESPNSEVEVECLHVGSSLLTPRVQDEDIPTCWREKQNHSLTDNNRHLKLLFTTSCLMFLPVSKIPIVAPIPDIMKVRIAAFLQKGMAHVPIPVTNMENPGGKRTGNDEHLVCTVSSKNVLHVGTVVVAPRTVFGVTPVMLPRAQAYVLCELHSKASVCN